MTKYMKAKSIMIFPSELEEFTGQIFDPLLHQQEITDANQVIEGFLKDMDENRLPIATLQEVRMAAGNIGLYAGYPVDACHMESFLGSYLAGSSYRKTALILKEFVIDMNVLIQTRMTLSQAAKDFVTNSDNPIVASRVVNNDDIPF